MVVAKHHRTMKNAIAVIGPVLGLLLALSATTEQSALANARYKSVLIQPKKKTTRTKTKKATRPATGEKTLRGKVETAPKPPRSTRYTKVQSFDVDAQGVTSAVFKGWFRQIAKKKGLLRRLEYGDYATGDLKPTTSAEIKAEFYDEITSTLDEAEALEIVGFLEASEKAGAKIQKSEWGDASAEWLGLFIVVQKPGAAKATVLDVLTNDNL